MCSDCQGSLDTPCLGGSDLQNHYGKLSKVAHVANEMHKQGNKTKRVLYLASYLQLGTVLCKEREKDEKWSVHSLPGSLEEM